MSQSRTRRAARVVAAAVAAATLGTSLGGCAQIYWDRRDTVGLSAGDAIAANKAVETIDPWPAASGNTHIVFNGQRMQAAAERYRTNTVIQPLDPMTMQVAASPTQSSTTSGGTPNNSTSNTTIVVGAPASTTTSSQ